MESLSEVKSGEVRTVKWLFGNQGVVDWMDSHHMRQGAQVQVIQNSIGSLIVDVDGSRLALGREVAERIKV